MVTSAHVVDQRRRRRRVRHGLGIVRVRKDRLGAGRIESPAVGAEFDAMIELE